MTQCNDRSFKNARIWLNQFAQITRVEVMKKWIWLVVEKVDMSKEISDYLDSLEACESITRQRSEIVSNWTRDGSAAGGQSKLAVREVTFDDLFREKFIPLDSRKKVGDYVLGRILGEGTFSTVRVARHVSGGEKVCFYSQFTVYSQYSPQQCLLYKFTNF